MFCDPRRVSRVITVAAFALTSAVVAGCSSSSDGEVATEKVVGSNKIVTVERALAAPFTQVELRFPCTFNVHHGDKANMTITFDDNLIPLVTSDVTTDVLTIATTKSLSNQGKAKVDLTCPHLARLNIRGAAKTEIDDLKEKNFNLTVDGAADVHAAGECDELGITVNGAGNVDARNLKTHNASVTINGAGNSVVNASDSVNGTINGAGSIHYKGSAEKITRNIHGVGSIAAL